MTVKNKIAVVGAGYVGMSMSVLLAQKNSVITLDLDQERVNKINNKKSTIEDVDISAFLNDKDLDLRATLDFNEAIEFADIIVIATPTDYDSEANYFDTRSVDGVINEALKINNNALIVIKSTIPVGHTASLQKKFNNKDIIFSPEFLREGQALKDNLYPSRIIIGSDSIKARGFANLLNESTYKEDCETLYVDSSEAEAIKLFANSYLAMRVSFFNEMDSYALKNDLDTLSIIKGVELDQRIGSGYNNPSFGYGGYCFPKDTKQLLSNFDDVPQNIISAIVESNETRKKYLSEIILNKNPKNIGIFKLAMKEGSDNFRMSAIQDIALYLKNKGVNILIYEPSIEDSFFEGYKVCNDIKKFKETSDIILANRKSHKLNDVADKVFSRDVFGTD
jgi:UDPglucose 6-dehydrogenase